MSSVRLHLLTNPTFLGEKNQALGIKTMLEKQYTLKIIETNAWDDSKNEELVALQALIDAESDTQHILIATGDHGLEALQKFKHSANKNVLSVYSSHQIFPELKKAASYIDIAALPTHVIDQQIRSELSALNLRLIETVGVAHNVSVAELDEAYSNWQKESKAPIVPSENYIGVILGGDAPEPNGTMRYFTAKEATQLAKYLVELSKQNNNATLLITNSPRTGKYDPITQKEQKVHTGETLDETSKALLNELHLHKDTVQHQFFDFVSGNKSAYKPILGALQKNQNSIAVVTGDSTSMVTEMTDSLIDKPLYIINVGSMNNSHKAHARSVNEAGYAHLVTLDDKVHIVSPKENTLTKQKRVTAAESIAKTIGNSFLVVNTRPQKAPVLSGVTTFQPAPVQAVSKSEPPTMAEKLNLLCITPRV